MTLVDRQRSARASRLLDTLPGEAAWMDQALCDGVNPDLFFPEGGTGPQREHTAGRSKRRKPSAAAAPSRRPASTTPRPKASRRTNCGTPAAAARHRAHGEPVDQLCRLAESMYRAQLKAIRKEGATA